MRYDNTVQHPRRRRRRDVAARLLLVPAVAVAALVATAPLAVAAELVGPGHSGPAEAGKPETLSVGLSGDDCNGMPVTFTFVGGGSATTPATGQPGSCAATQTLKVPRPATCPGPVTAVITIPGDRATVTFTATCPPTPSQTPTPQPTRTPSTPPSTPPPPPSHTASHTPTRTAAPSVSASSPIATPAPTSTDALALAPLLPPDDGGPRPPGNGGLNAPTSLAALVLLVAGGAGGLLLWQRGAGPFQVIAILGGAAVLAAGALVVPHVLRHQAPRASLVAAKPVSKDAKIPAGGTSSATATCPTGAAVVGGGARVTGGAEADLSTSRPTPSGWTVTATAPASGGLTVTAIAVCAPGVAAATTSSDGPYTVDTRQAQRTQARCAVGSPLAVGWDLPSGHPLAVLPLATGGSVTAWAVPPDVFGSTVVLCSAASYPGVQRATGQPVDVTAGQAAQALAGCPAGTVAVGGGFLPTSPADGRLADVAVQEAAPTDDGYQVTATVSGAGSAAHLTAYALCVGS